VRLPMIASIFYHFFNNLELFFEIKASSFDSIFSFSSISTLKVNFTAKISNSKGKKNKEIDKKALINRDFFQRVSTIYR